MRPALPFAVLLALANFVAAQDLVDLRTRCLNALHGENAPPSRADVLVEKPKPVPGRVVIGGPRAPGAIPKHACPLCTKELVQVDLWKGKAGIDNQDIFTAHVCEQHELFFVTNDGVMCSSQAGPFALPVDAKAKPVRPFLPYGAVVADDKEAWPASKWASADGKLYLGELGDGPFQVRNTDRVLYLEPKAESNGMGIVSHDISGDAGLCAYAHSMGPLVVAELGTGKRRARVPMRADNITEIAIHPAGTHVVFVVLEGGHQQSSLRVLDVGTGKVRVLAREPATIPQFFAFTRGDLFVAAGWNGNVSGWSLANGRREWERTLDAGKAAYRALSMAPDGKRVLFFSRGGLLASLLDVRTGTVDSDLVVRAPHDDERGGGPVKAAWSADSTKFVWSFGHGRLARSDVATPGEVKRHFGAAELLGYQGALSPLRFLADGKSVQSRDRDGHQLRWPLATFDAPW